MTGSPGPLRAVLAAFTDGAGTVGEVERRTGLAPDVVRLAAGRLVALGRLEAVELSSGCPATGCGGCAVASCGLPVTRAVKPD